ncbi:MAG TPA: hypothetical protein VFG62_24885 [Rhodopila sp.]|nr:hypothetical protein [Rhodopila sp.]
MSATAQTQPAPRISPVNDLVNLLIVMLTPVFLGPAGGDLRLARLGAQQALLAFKAEHHADWLTIAQIVAFGLATLNTLCLSFVEDLPIQAVLRLNNSADRLSKAEMRHRKVRQEPKGAAAPQPAQAIQPTPMPAVPRQSATNSSTAAPLSQAQPAAAKSALSSAAAEAAVPEPADSIQAPPIPTAAGSAATKSPLVLPVIPVEAAAIKAAGLTTPAGEAMPRTTEHAPERRRGGPALPLVQTDPPSAAWMESAARGVGEYLAAMPDLDSAAAEQAMLRANALSEAARDVAGGGPLPAEPVFRLTSDNRRR